MDQPIINDRLGDFITSLSQLSDPGDASFDGERIKGIRERAAAILNGPDAPVIDALLAPPTPGTRLPEGACPHGSYRHVCDECLSVTVAAPMVEQGETPECDAVAEFIHDKGMTEWVPAEIARSLERRLRSKATATSCKNCKRSEDSHKDGFCVHDFGVGPSRYEATATEE